jgi:hypothetical protein
VVAERGNRGATNFQILANGIVFGDVGLHFITQSFIQRALASNRCLPRSLGSTTRFFDLAPALGSKPAHFCSAFTFAEFTTGSLFEFGDIRSLFASFSLALGAHFFLRKMHTTTAPARTCQLTPLVL